MNSTTVTTFSSLGEDQALRFLGEIIDSKIAFTEFESRKLFKSPKEGGEAASDVAKQPNSAPVGALALFDFFAYLEKLSKTLRWLEVFKIVMHSDNITLILDLLENDKYLSKPDREIEVLLSIPSRLPY
ncbi:MAG: hypothetical protein RIS64_3600 [Bacteroidota bacterium]|jgi:hypothetical protein